MTGQFGHYQVLEKIGAGAMGEVFRARDERLGRDVAIKLIRPASSQNPDHLRRFELEARAAAALNHPNIVAIYDVGFEGDSPYIVSELLEGKTLTKRLSEGPLSTREASDYALQIVQGLIAAHDRHIVHRDLKPDNLFITNDGRIKILDFGVAKLEPPTEEKVSIENLPTVTKHGTLIGTQAYMSPEQVRGQSVDPRSDIFSFGAVLYEMMSGNRAFRGETEADTMTAVLLSEPSGLALDEAAIPPAYQDIVKHCLEKEREDRFQSARDLGFALQTVAAPGKQAASWKPTTRFSKLLPWAVAAVLGVLVVILSTSELLRAPVSRPMYMGLTSEAGTIDSARFAPDHSIVYSAAWNNKPSQLFSTVANSLLSQPLQLTDASLLSVSRKHELAIVQHGVHSGQLETVNGMLARAEIAGASPREILPDVRWADWAANSNDMAVVHYVSAQCRLEYPIGTVLYQTAGWISDIRFSPNYDSIAFMDHPALWDNRGAVRVTDLSGHVRTLTQEWDSERGLAWGPGGKEIWFTGVDKGNKLNLMAVSLSGKLRHILDLPMAINLQDVDSDGRVLASLDQKRLIMGASTLGGADIDISSHDWTIPHDISPDGQLVLFEDSSEAVGPGYAVMVRKADGSAPPVRIGEGSAGGFSPDGKWAISISTSPSQAAQLTLLPVGPGQPRIINVSGLQRINNGWARFFPDGKHIGLNGNETGHGKRCYAIDVSDGTAKPATPEGVLCGPISADGRSIVGKIENQPFALYSVDGSGAPRTIPNLKSNFTPVQWANDDSNLYGYHWGEFPSGVYKLEVATGKETLVQQLKPNAAAGVVLVAPVVVSRDGKHFAYSYNQTLSSLYLITGVR
jgi:serine/threonine protein kinase